MVKTYNLHNVQRQCTSQAAVDSPTASFSTQDLLCEEPGTSLASNPASPEMERATSLEITSTLRHVAIVSSQGSAEVSQTTTTAVHIVPTPSTAAAASDDGAPGSELDSGTGSSDSGSDTGSEDGPCMDPVENVSPHRGAPPALQPPAAPKPGDARVGLIYDELMEQHTGPDHYENQQRIIQVYATLEEEGLMDRCWRLPAHAATDAELLRAHSEEHVRHVDGMYNNFSDGTEQHIRQGADLYVCKDTASAARMAAGCCVAAVQSVLGSRGMDTCFAVVRPPGHHAECARAQGFCFYNNVCVAARDALQHPDVQRVLVLDWDVHHGNGIQEILYQDPQVLYISLHRDPSKFYPYNAGFKEEAGEGKGEGFNINIPWTRRGMGDAEYEAAFELVVEPVVRSFSPDIVIVAAGYDAAEGDPLGGCKLTPEGYASMTRRLMAFAGGRLVLALEGGYNTRVTADCVAACIKAMLEGRPGSQGGSSQHLSSSSLASKEVEGIRVSQRESSPEVDGSQHSQQEQRQPPDRGSRQGTPEECVSGQQQRDCSPAAITGASSGGRAAHSVQPQAGEPAQGHGGALQQQQQQQQASEAQAAQDTSVPAAGASGSSESTATGAGRRPSSGRAGRGAGNAAAAVESQPGGTRLARFLRSKQQEAAAVVRSGGSASSETQGVSTSSTLKGRAGVDGGGSGVTWPVGEAVKNLRAVCEVQAKYWPVLEGFTARWQAYEKKLQGARRRPG